VERTFDDLATPLHEVTFCVLDLETTGTSPQGDAITEVGAVKVRGGERLGTFHTMVDPGVSLSPFVSALTGITESMLASSPLVRQVLPSLVEFAGGSVLVGHNVRFDASFLDAACAAHERPGVGLRQVDTAGLARRLLRDDEVPNCKLGTLAAVFHLDHQPTHRALDDALATVDLLHLLLERAAAFGVSCLDDLLTLPALAGHPQAAKLRLTNRLPRSPGVYLFRDGQGRPIYVGRATDLRRRVRSFFSGDDRRTMGRVLLAAHAIDHIACSSSLEAGAVEARLLAGLRPRWNRHGTGWPGYRYIGLTRGRSPRLAVVRTPPRDGGQALGPVSSTRTARALVATLEAESHTDRLVGGLVIEAERIVDRLRQRAATDPAPAAATAHDQATALARVLDRQRRLDTLRRAKRIVLELPNGTLAEIAHGRLLVPHNPIEPPHDATHGEIEVAAEGEVVPSDIVDEMLFVATWLERHGDEVRLVHVDGTFASRLPERWPGSEAAPGDDLRSIAC
jgi:DNA polymerase-3 subunit epsilon